MNAPVLSPRQANRAPKVVDIRDDADSDERDDALEGGRVPPSSLDSEGVILSALLMGDEADYTRVVAAGLRADHFYAHANASVFAAVVGVRGKHGRVDPVLVANWMRGAGTLRGAGGSLYLAQLIDCTPASSNLLLHMAEVVERAKQRELIYTMQRVAIRLRAGELSHEEARGELREHFKEMSK